MGMGVVANAFALWLASFPLKLVGFQLIFDDALRVASLLALLWLRLVLPHLLGEAFFAVLGQCDAKLRASIEAMPVIRGLGAQLLQRLLAGGALVAVVVPALVCALTVMPSFLTLWAFLASTWVVVVPVALFLMMLLAGGAWGYGLIRPFLVLWRMVDPIVALVALVLLLTGELRSGSLSTVVRNGMVLYFSSMVLTQQLLAQYAQRQDLQSWTAFTAQHRWRIFGFGLPIWFLIHRQPVVAVALLDVLHGAAGALLADLKAAENNMRSMRVA